MEGIEGNSPCDVAMERPHSWVVCDILKNKISAGLDKLGVSPLRVLRVNDLAVPFTETLGKDEKVVAVEMHRMANRHPEGDGVVQDDAHGTRLPKVVQVPWAGLRERCIASLRKQQRRVVIVSVVATIVQIPVKISSLIDVDSNVDDLSKSWVRGRCDRHKRHGLLERVLEQLLKSNVSLLSGVVRYIHLHKYSQYTATLATLAPS